VTGSAARPRIRLGAAVALLLLAAAASAQDPFGTSDPYESQFKAKPHFQIRFRPPTKGGEVRLYTKKPVHYEKDVSWDGSDEVVIEYQDVKITADSAHYDFPTKTATLVGHVVIDQGPTRMAGDRGTFQIEAKTGILENATADLAPTYHVIAKSIEKIGEATYRIRDGIFTACDVPRPDWSFRLSEAVVTLDDYARMKNVTFRARSVPLLYTPYLVWPTKEDRASGLLVPGLGFSSGRGAYLGLTDYWVTGRSTDLTSNLDLYSRGTIGVGEEFRWTPTAESAGVVQAYGVHDTDATVCVPLTQAPATGTACTLPDGTAGVFAQRTKDRWKLRLDHVSDDLPYGFRGVVAIRDYSDEQYLQDFERSFALSSARQILSRAFLTRNFGDDSLNLRFERSETFFGTTVTQERLPSLEFSRRTSRIGESPVFFALESSVSWLYINRGPNLPRGDYARADVHPTVSLPWKRIPWLSVTARAGGRFTEYTDSTDSAETRFVSENLTREYFETGISIVGPSFSRIYDADIGKFGKFKHVIEPRIDYTYVSNVGDPARIPAYDEIDLQLGMNQIRYAIVNRLLARPSDPKAGAATEIASFEIAQTRNFTLPQSPFEDTSTSFEPVISKTGPVEATLRVAPGTSFHLDGRLSYDSGASQITGTSLSAAYNWKASFVNATWFASRPVVSTALPPGSISPNSDQLRAAAGVDLSKAFRVETQLNYDATQKLLLEDRSLLTYRGSCFSIFVELRQLRLPPTPRRDLRFVVNLKDIGTLLDLHQSVDRLFGQ
jgi:LPS-assembly protein